LESVDALQGHSYSDTQVSLIESINDLFRPSAAILVDANNLLWTGLDHFGHKVDYQRLMAEVRREYRIVNATAYTVSRDGNAWAFHQRLRHLGYTVKDREPEMQPDGTWRADWDDQIIADAYALADQIDCCWVATHDGHFAPLVADFLRLGIDVQIVAWPEYTSFLLQELAPIRDLSNLIYQPYGSLHYA
jgi:uncharacterized LabA/DUF88 family protein